MKTIFALLFLLCLSVPLLYPLFQSGYPKTHDGMWAVVRLAEMKRELKDGQFPPRWAGYLNHGYGYPLFLFTYPLPFYLGMIPYVMGFGAVNTLKLLFITATLGGVSAQFLLARRLWGNWGGLISAALYLYAPYRILNLYTRGSVGELISWVWYPALFLSSWQLIQSGKRGNFFLTIISISLLIFSHNAAAILFLPFLGSWMLFWLFTVRSKKINRIKISALAILAALALSASFWLPAMVEKKFIALSVTPLTNRIVHFLSIAVFFGKKIHETTGISLQVGNILLLVALCGLFLVLWQKRAPVQHTRIYIFLLILSVSAILLMFPVSTIFWQLPVLKDIDFPWRMMGVVIFLLSLGSGFVFQLSWGKYLTIPCILLVLFNQVSTVRLLEKLDQGDSYYETNDATTTSNDELMPVWVSQKPVRRFAEKVVVSEGQASVTSLSEYSNRLIFQINAKTAAQLTVNTVYFPGWSAKAGTTGFSVIPVNAQEETGLITFPVPAGIQKVIVEFRRTPIRIAADVISVITLILLLWLWKNSKSFFHLFS